MIKINMKILPILFSGLIIFLVFWLLIFSSPAYATGASFSFLPGTKSVTLDQTFSVNIVLNTGDNYTEEAQSIVLYDASKLKIISAILGNLYEHKLTADASVSGKINLRANSTTQTYSGTGTFATITFKAINVGKANTSFQFVASSTIDSNVFSASQDILSLVSSGVYTIATSSAVNDGTPTASPSATRYKPPVTGTSWPTILLLISGGFLFLLGLFSKKVLKTAGS